MSRIEGAGFGGPSRGGSGQVPRETAGLKSRIENEVEGVGGCAGIRSDWRDCFGSKAT